MRWCKAQGGRGVSPLPTLGRHTKLFGVLKIMKDIKLSRVKMQLSEVRILRIRAVPNNLQENREIETTALKTRRSERVEGFFICGNMVET